MTSEISIFLRRVVDEGLGWGLFAVGVFYPRGWGGSVILMRRVRLLFGWTDICGAPSPLQELACL